jgi:hypothetical protein
VGLQPLCQKIGITAPLQSRSMVFRTIGFKRRQLNRGYSTTKCGPLKDAHNTIRDSPQLNAGPDGYRDNPQLNAGPGGYNRVPNTHILMINSGQPTHILPAVTLPFIVSGVRNSTIWIRDPDTASCVHSGSRSIPERQHFGGQWFHLYTDVSVMPCTDVSVHGKTEAQAMVGSAFQ